MGNKQSKASDNHQCHVALNRMINRQLRITGRDCSACHARGEMTRLSQEKFDFLRRIPRAQSAKEMAEAISVNLSSDKNRQLVSKYLQRELQLLDELPESTTQEELQLIQSQIEAVQAEKLNELWAFIKECDSMLGEVRQLVDSSGIGRQPTQVRR
ncbi:hypothetical protein EV356DRAFT_555664 [Viridothelium virens]|uniref:Uncharacterized protein n=1 Tax=Viridothelium virens TaxID=1048519 RepID=A0A6A6GVB6_VIRVR|nr:hypothetical protein EV356DRAFT_555664 [Viridothelium virens]